MTVLESLAAMVPLRGYALLRAGAVRLRRGTLLRSACVAVLKVAQRGWRGRLGRALTEIRPLDAPHLSFAPTDSMVVDTIYWLGVRGYEGKVADVWAELCCNASAVLEIGGNIGLFTTLGRRASRGTYTVVEPVPSIAAVLRGNLARNGIDHVEVLEAAAIPGDVAQTVLLSIPDEGRTAPVGAHLVEQVEVSGRRPLNQIAVQGVPITTLVAGRDLIKIDAEGIEAMLLRAAWPILVAERPTLMIEVLPEAKALGQTIADLARAAGYTIAVIPEYGRHDITVVAPQDFSAAVPQRYNSKDVVLSARAAPRGDPVAF